MSKVFGDDILFNVSGRSFEISSINHSFFNMKSTAAVITLGCRLNQTDSALITDRLARMGFEIVPQNSSSSLNLIVINSCAVTATAYRKSRQMMRSLRTENPQAYLVFTGCCADVYRHELERCEEIDLLLVNDEKKDLDVILPKYLANLKTRKGQLSHWTDDGAFLEQAVGSFPFRSRAFLKIQEGCENFCSYCIVPYARGKERSRDMEEIAAEFQEQISRGFHEVVLTGVNTCHYSCGGVGLPQLLDRLCEIPGEYRIRLSSTEPDEELPEIIDAMSRHADKICPFLHLALQSGSDTILKSMNRHYTASRYAEYVQMAREKIPGLHLGTDIIVGYPGETDDLFEESLAFIESMKFANIHIFPYSPREGTPAAEMPRDLFPSAEAVSERQERLNAVKEDSAKNFAQSLVGTEGDVLFETLSGDNKDIWGGWSGSYVKVLMRSNEDLSRKLLHVKFLRFLPNGALLAQPLESL